MRLIEITYDPHEHWGIPLIEVAVFPFTYDDAIVFDFAYERMVDTAERSTYWREFDKEWNN